MVHVLFITVLDSKIIYHQVKLYVSVLVCIESLGGSCRCIDIGFEVFIERFMSYDSCLNHAIHYFFDYDIYVAVYLLVVRVILVYYFWGNDFYHCSVILILLCCIVLVEVLDIYYKVFSTWGGDDAVPTEFGRG